MKVPNMSYLLGLPIPDHQAMIDLRRHLENGASTPNNLTAIKTAMALEYFFFNYGERILFGPINQPSEPGYIHTNPDSNITMDPTPVVSDNILAESIYVPPSPEQVIADQAHRITSMDIEYGVGEITKRVSYFLSDPLPTYDIKNDVTLEVDSDIEPRKLQERISKIADSVVTSRIRTPSSSEQDTGNYKGINHKRAMEIADNPAPYNREALEEALRVLLRHILTK